MDSRSPSAASPQTSAARAAQSTSYSDSCLHIEHAKFFLAIKRRPVALSKTEFRIVSCLITKLDRVVTLQELWNYCWDATKKLERRRIHALVSRARRKLAPFGIRINSVVEVGYILSHGNCCSEELPNPPPKVSSEKREPDPEE